MYIYMYVYTYMYMYIYMRELVMGREWEAMKASGVWEEPYKG